jgi:hypothetical protein
MRKELTAAQEKVKAMAHEVRMAQRNVDVMQQEKKDMSCSLAGNVGKLEKLLQQARVMRQDRAQMQVEINAGRRRVKHRLEVHPCTVVLSCLILFDSSFSCLHQGAAGGSA